MPKGKRFPKKISQTVNNIGSYKKTESQIESPPLFSLVLNLLYHQKSKDFFNLVQSLVGYQDYDFIVDSLYRVIRFSVKSLFFWFKTRDIELMEFPIECFTHFNLKTGENLDTIPICEILYEFILSSDPYYLICIFKVISHLFYEISEISSSRIWIPDLSKKIKTSTDYVDLKNLFYVCAQLYYITKNLDVLDKHLSKLNESPHFQRSNQVENKLE